jgi:hypothetical protein
MMGVEVISGHIGGGRWQASPSASDGDQEPKV